MIRAQIHITVLCDRCETGLTGDPDAPAGHAAVFADRIAALVALDEAVTHQGWARSGGRLLCPLCAARALCLFHGHEFRNVHDHGPHGIGDDLTAGWRSCACDRSIPSHADARPDPAGGPGCGMEWRLCGRCDHVDERHVAALFEHQPGGHLRQDVPAGLAHSHRSTGTRLGVRMSSKENVMVGPRSRVGREALRTAGGGSR